MNSKAETNDEYAIDRASFLAFWQGLIGLWVLVPAVVGIATVGVAIDRVGQAVLGTGILAVAVFTYFNADSLRWGTDSPPRSWFVLAAIGLVLLFSITVVAVV